jgi:DNA-binding SARP family transcriptional activator
MNVLNISLFGTVRISHSNPSIPSCKSTHTIQALLAYLTLQRNRLHPRDVLAGLFWGEYDSVRARNCLNTALWRLRQVVEPDGVPDGTYLLTNDHGDIGFNRDSPHWLDVAALEAGLRPVRDTLPQALEEQQARALESALVLYTGDLLEGFYDEWALREREQMRRLYLSGQAYLMQYYKHHRRYEQGIACGHKILLHDPLREEIHREMMRLYAESGQRSLVAYQYDVCVRALATELGVTPLEETQRLYQQLVVASPAEAVTSLRDPRAEIEESIALLQQTVQSLAAIQREMLQAAQRLRSLVQPNGEQQH